MKSFNDARAARRIRFAAALIPALALAACASSGPRQAAPIAAPYGPQADYPVIVGEPYQVAGKTFTPEDVLNYDKVGYIAADPAGGSAVSGSHHTLPLPSYVEVTSLETGRTIVVRLERRGPMDGHELIALSPGAMSQLDASQGTAVRVRRVNPPEDQRALLRAGQAAAPRMDTPMSLVAILKRELPGANLAEPAPPAPGAPVAPVAPTVAAAPAPVAAPDETLPPLPPLPPLAQVPPTTGSPPPAAPQRPAAPAREGAFVVQAAAFSTAARAQSAAKALGGQVTQAGRYYRVRTGPFASRSEAEASLAKVRAAGYSDARILTSG